MKFIENLFGSEQKATKTTIDLVELANLRGQVAAIDKSQGVIEFGLDGIIIDANNNFLNLLGYRIDEVKGKHHSIFVDSTFRQSMEYRMFWDRLARGDYD